MLCGGVDTGKTHTARRLLRAAVDAGRTAAWLDADLGQSSVGPPTTLGLRDITRAQQLDDATGPDELYFVGALSPRAHLLPSLAGIAHLARRARYRDRLTVIDTGGFITGAAGQRFLFHLLEVTTPDLVVGLQRAGELSPLLSAAERFGTADVTALAVHPDARAKSPQRRAHRRREQLAAYFGDHGPPRRLTAATHFFPALPPALDPSALQGLLVGVQGAEGHQLGIGVLTGGLRLVVPRELERAVDDEVALRLGSVRVEPDWTPREIDLRRVLRAL